MAAIRIIHMAFTKFTHEREKKVRINEGIRASEMRVIDENGGNLGVLTVQAAIERARTLGLDLIEISPNAKPPVGRIADYGKFRYEQNKKARDVKAKSHVTETKNVQVKVGTSENDMFIKASRAASWLREGHRVKVDLFLWGRYKGMDFDFLKERLERFLAIIPESYKIADEVQKGPKGLTVTLERDRTAAKKPQSAPKTETEPTSTDTAETPKMA
jgi:translation initiation factor IF-3